MDKLRRNISILIINAYDKQGLEKERINNIHDSSILFTNIIKKYIPEDEPLKIETIYPAIEKKNHSIIWLEQFDGIIWSGSSLSLSTYKKKIDFEYCTKKAKITDLNKWNHYPQKIQRQLNLCENAFKSGTPQYGSCWGMQVASVVCGYKCIKNKKGYEFPFADNITLTKIGKNHKMYEGKKNNFDAYCSHRDIIIIDNIKNDVKLNILSKNKKSPVQSVEIKKDLGEFWGCQYHPEYDLDVINKKILYKKFPTKNLIYKKIKSDEKEIELKNWVHHIIDKSKSKSFLSNYIKIKANIQNNNKWKIQEFDHFGAIIKNIDLKIITFDDIKNLRYLLNHFEVIFFRDQDISDRFFIKFAKLFGNIHYHPSYPNINELTILENNKDKPPLIEKWHSDMTFIGNPPMATLLFGSIIPDNPKGGNTEFLSTSLSYNDLPNSIKKDIESLEAEHSYEFGFQESIALGNKNVIDSVKKNPPINHPVVRYHPENERKSLFINPLFTKRILNIPENESNDILEYLFNHMQKDKYKISFDWEKNSIAFWDNRITQHRPINDYYPQYRKMKRITII